MSPSNVSEPAPFRAFLNNLQSRDGRRARLDEVYREHEPDIVTRLAEVAELSPNVASEARALARRLVESLRARPAGGMVQGLMR